jgi:Na+/melibiose symporter-like transporter
VAGTAQKDLNKLCFLNMSSKSVFFHQNKRNVRMLFLLISLFALPVLASGWSEGTMSAGFWVMVGLAGVIGIILLLLFLCWCCMPIRGASERFDALPGASDQNKTDLYGNPQAYDATMHRVAATPIFSVAIRGGNNKNE